MKYLFIILISLVVLTGCAPKPIKYTALQYPQPFQFELIDTVNLSKDEIYVKCHEWIAKSFGSAKAVIDMQDKAAGKLIGKPLTIEPVLSGEVTYIISIDVKEGKYRATISDFYHSKGIAGYTGSTISMPIYKSYGTLDRDKHEYKSMSTGKMVIDQKFFGVKNYIMTFSEALLLGLKAAVHSKEKEY